MNILFPYMARWKSANWTRYHNLLTEFAKRGHKIYVIQPPSLKSKETNFLDMDIEINENINLITFSNIPFWKLNLPFSKIIKKGIYIYLLSEKINYYIKKYNIDIVLIYNLPQYLIAKKLKVKVKIIFDICDDYPEMLVHEIKIFKKLIRNIGKLFLNKIIKTSDLVITSANELKEKYIKNAYIIPNGGDLNLLDISYSNNKINDKLIIGFIGSFEYFIDFKLIFYLAKNLQNMKFILIGSGRLFNKIKKYIQQNNLNNIILTGPIIHSKLNKYLREFNIALMPFKKIEVSDNTCPLKLFEYALFRIPIIGINLKELKFIGNDFINFYNTKEEALDLTIDINKNKTKYIDKCEIGYNLIKTKYNWNLLADQYLEIIRHKFNVN